MFGQTPAWQTGTNTLYAPTGINIGVGVPTPAAPLHVLAPLGGETIRLDSAGSAGWMRFTAGTSTRGYLGFGSAGSMFTGGLTDAINLRSQGPIVFGTNGDNVRMVIDSAGHAGIGTTTPTSPLHVYTSLGGDAIRIDSPTANGWLQFNSADTIKGYVGFADAGGLFTSGLTNAMNIRSQGPLLFGTNGDNVRMTIDNNGNIGIGTLAPQYKLAVNGVMGAKEVIVSTTGWADYVFNPAHRLVPLRDVAAFIRANHHLPGIPSEAEVQEKGVSVGEMQVKLLAKIEELTLHLIEMERKNQELQERVTRLERPDGAAKEEQ